MMQQELEKEKQRNISDYLYILYKWKKFFIINLILVVGITIGITLLIPNQYKATSTVMIPQDTQMGLGGLSSLLGGRSSIASAGSRLFGVSNTSEDVLLGILNSRTLLTDVINKFHLMEYYEIKDNNMDKVLKAFRNDISSSPNEFGMIEFSVINKDPNKSAEIANYLVKLVDSSNIRYNIERAKNNRSFVEKRYNQNVSDLRKAENDLYAFQRKYGIVAVPEQLEATVKAAAEIESELIKKEMEAYFTQQSFGENSPQYQGISAQIRLLRNKVQELKNSPNLSASSNVLFPFKEMPDISIEYLRAFREVEIQQSILEIVMPMYEQSKVEEQKSIPTVVIIDSAVPPQLKDSPKRMTIVLGVFFLFSFIFVILIFLGERAVMREKFENPLQIKEANFFNKIIKIYRIKY